MAIRELLDLILIRGIGKQGLRREQHAGDSRKLTGQQLQVARHRAAGKAEDSDVPATLGGYGAWP